MTPQNQLPTNLGLDLSGRTAVITGASRGIGLAAAQAIAAAGGNVVLTSRSQESADAAAIQVNGSAMGVAAHAVDEEAARRCIGITLERFGSVDILINNAGTNPAYGPVIDQDHARFAKTLDVNLWAPILWTSVAARAWMAEHGGVVVNTASIGGMGCEPNLGLYNTSKAALIHITKQMALELSPKIRVNAVAPGVVRTKLAEALWKENELEVAASIPLNRIGSPEDVGAGHRIHRVRCGELDDGRNHRDRRWSAARRRPSVPERSRRWCVTADKRTGTDRCCARRPQFVRGRPSRVSSRWHD